MDQLLVHLKAFRQPHYWLVMHPSSRSSVSPMADFTEQTVMHSVTLFKLRGKQAVHSSQYSVI